MTELASVALMRTASAALIAAGGVFDDRVFLRYAPSGTQKPYVVMVIAGGGESNQRKYADAELLLQAVCYADTALDSTGGAQTIDETLNDKGEQDTSSSPLSPSGEWHILTVSGERILSNVEQYDKIDPVFADGKTYRVKMETGL